MGTSPTHTHVLVRYLQRTRVSATWCWHSEQIASHVAKAGVLCGLPFWGRAGHTRLFLTF